MTSFAPPRRRPANLIDPTGRPSWSRTLLSGPTGSRKSGIAALFSADDRIARMVWVEIGEDETTAHEYGAIPGVKYSILRHDGTFIDIYEQLVDAYYQALEAETRGEVWALTVDSMGGLNDMLVDMGDARARRKRAKNDEEALDPNATIWSADYEATITTELRGLIKKRHKQFMRVVHNWPGPVTMISSERMATVFENGQPTNRQDWWLDARKDLPKSCTAHVRLAEGGAATIVKLRSVREMVSPDARACPWPAADFSLARLVFDWVGCVPGESRAPEDIEYDADQDMPDEYHRGSASNGPGYRAPAGPTAEQIEDRRRKARAVVLWALEPTDVDKAATRATRLQTHTAAAEDVLPLLTEEERERLGIGPDVAALTLSELGPWVVDYVDRHKRSVLAPLDDEPAAATDDAPAGDDAIREKFAEHMDEMVRDDKRMMRELVGN